MPNAVGINSNRIDEIKRQTAEYNAQIDAIRQRAEREYYKDDDGNYIAPIEHLNAIEDTIAPLVWNRDALIRELKEDIMPVHHADYVANNPVQGLAELDFTD